MTSYFPIIGTGEYSADYHKTSGLSIPFEYYYDGNIKFIDKPAWLNNSDVWFTITNLTGIHNLNIRFERTIIQIDTIIPPYKYKINVYAIGGPYLKMQ